MAEPEVLPEVKQRASGAAVAGVVVLALSAVIGVTWGPQMGILALVAFIAVSAMSSSIGEVSIPFLLSLAAVLIVIAEFILPDVVVSAFTPVARVIEVYLGVSLASFDAVQFAVLTAAAIFVIWVFQIRMGRYGAKKPDTIFKRIANQKIPALAEIYADISRRMVALTISVIAIIAIQLGGLSGDIVAELSKFPVAASNMFAGIIGFSALGGDLPVLGDIQFLQVLGPADYFVIVLLVFAVAVGVRNTQD